MLRALAVLAAVFLCGCGGGSGAGSFLSSAGNMFGGSSKVSVAPIVGAPPNVSEELVQALVAAGSERNMTLIPGTSGGNYVLRGYLLATPETRGSKISYIWDVSDAKGERVARISGEEAVSRGSAADPWSGVDSATIRSIAGKTTSQLSASLGKGSPSTATPVAAAAPAAAPVTTATAVASKPAGVIVAPVSGAPGDGQRSLPTALKKRLYAGGVKLANGAASNVYTVKGSVSMSDASGGKQSIRIDWQVLDPNGRRLGTVSQQNTIPRGSLNGPWGAVADAAAGAAANGIIKLLPKSG